MNAKLFGGLNATKAIEDMYAKLVGGLNATKAIEDMYAKMSSSTAKVVDTLGSLANPGEALGPNAASKISEGRADGRECPEPGANLGDVAKPDDPE